MLGVINVWISRSFTMILTVSMDSGQIPFVTFHKKIFSPWERLLTDVFGRLLSASSPVPEITDQVPDSYSLARLPFRVASCWLYRIISSHGSVIGDSYTVTVTGLRS